HTFTLPPLPPPPPPPSNSTMENRINQLKLMMADMMSMMKEMPLLLGCSFASDRPPASSKDDMDVADEEGLD
ncbi:UNVERIFIED_CONTAM: hypothetical protein Sindi_0946100, partial [Sesamum indicum]